MAATNADTSWRFRETKKSGLMGTDGIGFTIGSSKSTHDLREQGTTQSGSYSTVGSTGGDVSITAGKQAHIGGADIIAQKDIAVRGDSVVIEPGYDKRTRDEKYEQKSSGLTAALSGLAGGDIAGALAGAAAPELAYRIGHGSDLSDEAKVVAHAILGGAVAAIQGNSAAAGAAGAVTGELAAKAIAGVLYPDVKDPSKLTEEQKQTVSALATISAGMAGGLAGDSTGSAAAGAGAGKNAVENNAVAIPVPPPPVAGTNTGDAVNDANKTMASALDKKLKEMKEALDKATQCSFGRACAEDDAEQAEGPNAGKNLTDAEKAEFGGAGSGTGTPPPPENDSNQQNNKSEQKLNQKQESSIRKIDNLIKNSIKDHDITGTLKDMDSNPIIKPDSGGKYWNHMKEMQDTLNGLRNHANTLKNVNNPEAQAAYGRATDAINKLESAIKGYGI